MKSCAGCEYALWGRTNAGKLHPSGDGTCTFKVKIPPLPVSMFWDYAGNKPRASGG